MGDLIDLENYFEGPEPAKRYCARKVNGVYPPNDHVTFHADAGPVQENDLVFVFIGEEKPCLGRLVKASAGRIALMSMAPPSRWLSCPIRPPGLSGLFTNLIEHHGGGA
jgi:hypothetical protein